MTIDHIKKILLTNSIVENNFSFWFMVIRYIFRPESDLGPVTAFPVRSFFQHFNEARELVASVKPHDASKSPISRNMPKIDIYQNENLFFTIDLKEELHTPPRPWWAKP